jgi:hypothetical protein
VREVKMKERKNLRAPFASPRQDMDRPTSTGPQAVSAARVKGFGRENVSVFFSILETELEEIKIFSKQAFQRG